MTRVRFDSASRSASPPDPIRTGLGVDALKRAIQDQLTFQLARLPEIATRHDYYMALAYAVRDRLLHRWVHTMESYVQGSVKVACYLSAEFLLGPHLGSNLIALGIEQAARQAMAELGEDLDLILDEEEEPGLGNGGLGRLAACFLDSLATLQMPAFGYGIRYEFGIFDQEIRDGCQVEITDKWLSPGNPWETVRPDIACAVKLGGHTESYTDVHGRYRVRWIPHRLVKGIPYDTPILGYGVNTCNTLRLWSAQACESFDFRAFNVGDYYGAVDDKVFSETISKVLYPNDEPVAGKKLRLAQQYFFVSCSLQDMLRIHAMAGAPLERFPDHFAVQLNDTHPSIAVAELMRLLVDQRHMDWEPAWELTRATLGYTNHTLLPEALETWPLPMFQEMLPRHLEIIYEINHRFLEDVRRRIPGDEALVSRVSLIDEGGPKRVRMANLACVGSHAINGVAKLHTELLQSSVLRDFFALWPERFSNKTNGVTPRRFLRLANPALSALLDDSIGTNWARDLEQMRHLEPLAMDAGFRQRWREVKLDNKRRLSRLVHERTGVELPPEWLFDILVKRIHEYKRQHLDLLYIVTLYCRLKRVPSLQLPPRAFVFAGKAAPGYANAKLIIKLIHSVAEVVNGDPAVNQRLRMAFVPDFNVKNAQPIYPAADLSEQISMAGKEASGTGNMKFSMNGALTIGTLDGANVEIRDAVGPENFFLFGLNVEEAQELVHRGYRPQDAIDRHSELAEALRLIGEGHFSKGDRDRFRPLLDNLIQEDPYLVLADYASYVACQEDVSRAWTDTERWTRMSILNAARVGCFSSDRTIREYCRDIWGLRPVEVKLPT
jgi:starch phosphorylase